MNSFILIVVMNIYGESSVTTQEFNSKEACTDAKELVSSDFTGIVVNPPSIYCVSK